MQTSLHPTPDILPADASLAEFIFPPHSRPAAIAWGRERLADVLHHSDTDLTRACRVLISNSPEDYDRATKLLAVLGGRGA
ncbi:hypothetical protein [Falsirhodobacter halotolerans]|uniref:hypothetical protein n=1 Tax=Falsirhodobacter halotolerans TaxID=1146892 RepID=UPI001FD4D04D|nr:hypothetical protein [Falsirhodobacter halotolerans]MCJ8139590.1 hypothetical protein [Falsirhodobacter halotolerans]